MKIHVLLFLAMIGLVQNAAAQTPPAWNDSITAYWNRLNVEYADSATSPLKAEDRAHFKQLEHFAFDPAYCVQARFDRTKDAPAFAMKTTTAREPRYRTYGILHFTLNGVECALPVYENEVPHPEYPGYLFLPFTDLTNGEETYGGGRYIDLQAPLGDTVTVDFNKAYNPYCAYNHKYSCPIPPKENHLLTHVKAGVLKFHD
jgi:uncharacterized protein